MGRTNEYRRTLLTIHTLKVIYEKNNYTPACSRRLTSLAITTVENMVAGRGAPRHRHHTHPAAGRIGARACGADAVVDIGAQIGLGLAVQADVGEGDNLEAEGFLRG